MDTLRFISPQRPNGQMLRGYRRQGWLQNFHSRKLKRGGFLLQLHRPSALMLAAAEELSERNGWHFCGYEIAFDFQFETTIALRQFDEFLRRYISQRHRRPLSKCDEEAETFYFNPRKSRNNLVIYSDRRARLTGAPHCCHVEIRTRGSQAMHRRGVFVPGDLLALDFENVFSQTISFWQFDLARLGAEIRRCWAGNHSPDDTHIGHFGVHVGGHQINLGGQVSATCAKAACAYFGVRSQQVLTPLPFTITGTGRSAFDMQSHLTITPFGVPFILAITQPEIGCLEV
jgi:hypothetical protein